MEVTKTVWDILDKKGGSQSLSNATRSHCTNSAKNSSGLIIPYPPSISYILSKLIQFWGNTLRNLFQTHYNMGRKATASHQQKAIHLEIP